jgi:hypothetical protein
LEYGQATGAGECIADGVGSNSTLLKIDLSSCALRDEDVSIQEETLGSRNTTLQNLTLDGMSIIATGVGMLLETTQQSCHITGTELEGNHIRHDGAGLLARSLGNNSLPNLTRLSLSECGIGDDESALE